MKLWPVCFKSFVCTNTNMALEHFHRDFKHLFLYGNGKLTLSHLIRTIRKKLEDDIRKTYAKLRTPTATKRTPLQKRKRRNCE